MHIAANADEVFVYSLYQGDELMMSRRGTAEAIAKVRQAVEPLQVGFRATLGTGSAKDPVVAEGVPNNPNETGEERLARASLAQAREVSNLALKIVRDNLDLVQFSRTVLAETSGQIMAAREEARAQEAARWEGLIARMQQESQRPLISGDAVKELSGMASTLMSFLTKDKKNG
jgi:hypothetical protein